jgi:hypothetical protein
MWVITENPADYPGQFVARLCLITSGAVIHTETIHTADSLQAIRLKIPQNLIRFDRHESDPAVVVEAWF